MDLFDSADQYEDIEVAASCTLSWGFSLEPWDNTGSTVAFIVGASSFPMTLGFDGSQTSTFSIKIAPASLVALGLVNPGDLATYAVRETFPDATVQQIGHGEILITP